MSIITYREMNLTEADSMEGSEFPEFSTKDIKQEVEDIEGLWDNDDGDDGVLKGSENVSTNFPYRKNESLQARASKSLKLAIVRSKSYQQRENCLKDANSNGQLERSSFDTSCNDDGDVELIMHSKIKLQKRDPTSFKRASATATGTDCEMNGNEQPSTSFAPPEEKPPQDAWLSNSWKGQGTPHFTCEVCSTEFEKKFDFTRHLFKHRQQETEEQSFTCTECNILFHCKEALQDHYRRTDHGCGKYVMDENGVATLKKFKCPECPSEFSQKRYLLIHVKSHNRKYNCIYCDEVFDFEFQVESHMAHEHGISSEDETQGE